MKLGHIVKAQQFSRLWLEEEFFPLTEEMEKIIETEGSDVLSGKKMVSAFYVRSNRTRARFEIAMSWLGGRVVFSTENAREFSFGAEGETLEDTIRVLNRYRPDVIVLRYDEEGGAETAAEFSTVPIINAGDGLYGQHPTQALLDLYTIQKKLGRIDGVSIAMVGDLAKGRTVRSLSYLLAKFSGVRIYFVAPEVVKMRDDIKDHLREHGVWFAEESDLRNIVPEVDIVYLTAIRKGRAARLSMHGRGEGCYVVNREVLDIMRQDAVIMHPLPRDEDREIPFEVDGDPRAVYLEEQIDSGLFTAMALLKMILS